jgi:hypothetical protein
MQVSSNVRRQKLKAPPHMKCFAPMIAVVFCGVSNAQPMSCADFSQLPPKSQELFVYGLADGMATSHGVMDTFARLLKEPAKSDDEKIGIEKMRSLPQAYLSKGCCLSTAQMTEKIRKGCTTKPALPVGNILVDVLSGEL